MKKILFIVFCFVSCFLTSNVKAIDNSQITAHLSVSEAHENVSIPTLGRIHNNLYKMTLTNDYNNNQSKTFCLESGKKAKSGLTYLIDKEISVNNTTYRKVYQYGISASDDVGYFVAQAAFWLLMDNMALTYDNIYNVVQDIEINLKCESYMTLYGKATKDEAASVCSSAKTQGNGSSNFIINKIYLSYWDYIKSKNWGISYSEYTNSTWPSYRDQMLAIVRTKTQNFMNYNSYYSGKLYIWKESSGGGFQKMVGPLDGAPTSLKKTCTDSSGKIHDYTNEYNQCIINGGNSETCNSTLKLKYCNTVPTYTIEKNINSAVCTNTNESNVATSFEYTVEDPSGSDSKNGKLAVTINQYCSMYCLEKEANQIFPGNVRPAVSTGTYIIWPTSDFTISSVYGNKYPLKFTGTKTCVIEMAPNTVSNIDIDKQISQLRSDLQNANKRDTVFAKADYDTIRLNGGCDNRYNSICGQIEKELNTLENELSQLESDRKSLETAYKNAIDAMNDVDDHNDDVDSCQDDEENDYYACVNSCKGKKGCVCSWPNYNCGSYQSYSSSDVETKNKYENLLKEIDNVKTKVNNKQNELNACRGQQSSCNSFTGLVNSALSIANQLRSCSNYSAATCSGSSCQAYNYQTNVDLSWNDDEYGRIITDSELEKTVEYSSSIENNSSATTQVSFNTNWTSIINSTTNLLNEVRGVVSNKKYNYNVEVTYSLPTDNLLYNYIVKNNNGSIKFQNDMPLGDVNFTTVGYSNLPISVDASPKKTYSLSLLNVRYGDNGGQYQPDDYVCNYNVTKATPNSCVCPTGTTYAGKDLFKIMANENLSCLEAQTKYCNTTVYACPDGSMNSEVTNCMNENNGDYFACYDKYCASTDKNKYCPAPYDYINLTPCMENGHDYSTCYNMFCKDGPGPNPDRDGYHCKNTNGVDGEMDITSCVITKMSQGLNEQQAIDACDSLVCPIGGLRIIYRTISLENPFPGKNISNVVTGFNDDVKGRYPGSNWNNLNLVKNHILTVKRQGALYDGSNIYLEAEPLYTFELTTTTINAIREYNDQRLGSGGYADFRLDCRINNSIACVSDFVHNTSLSGLVSGVCANSTSASNFYSCSGD